MTCVVQDISARFVPRLGDMSFKGSMMGGTGLEDILKSILAVKPMMLSGKKFPQIVRVLCTVVEELCGQYRSPLRYIPLPITQNF